MDEDVQVTAGADLDVIGDEARAVLLQLLHGGAEVFDLQRDVVDALAALGDELAHRRIIRSGLQQFNAALAHGDHGDFHPLVFHRFFRDHAHAQLLIDAACRSDTLHRDTEMVDSGHLPNPRTISSTSV